MKKYYIAQPPNFKYTFRDYFMVIKAMNSLSKWKKKEKFDVRNNFENLFKSYIDKKYGISVNSCNTGLDIAIKVLDLEPNDEIISCAINFYGTHLSALGSPANLILCEADNTLNISVDDLEKKVNTKTKVILITHMNGLSANMERIIDICSNFKHRIYIVEDVARSCGAEYKSKKVGYYGDISVFSFQGKKNMSTLGEGGMILTNDKLLYLKMNQIRSFGEKEVWGSNYSLSRVQAAIGISQLSKLDKLNEKRIKVANQRTNILSKYSYFYLPQYEIFDKPIYTYYNIVFKEDYNASFRDEVRKILLNKYNIETSIANEPTYKVHKFIEKNIRKIDNNLSKNLGERIINLPIHYAMSRKDNIYICESFIKTIREVLKNGE